ncbi:hypothetical protein [Saccharopolyspora sp. CA-218241]|uniref:hypothetical protein n=1 Tax=Saccharopolyspora sp. CA-218241 TaxID=3240027 RepID=UPI003D96145C
MPDQDEFAERLAERRRALEAVRAGAEGPEAPAAESVGRSADKLIEITVRDHRVATVVVHRAVPGRPVPEIKERVAEAANSALAQARTKAPSATDPLPDLGAMREQLREVDERSGRLMRMVGSAIDDVVDQVGRRTGMHGNPAPDGVDALLGRAAGALRAAEDSLAGLRGPQVTGTGHDEGNEISAAVDPDGTVSIASMSTVARHMASEELGGALREAVNAALADWESQRREAMPSADDVDAESLQRLSDQAAALGEHSIEHLRGYTANLTAIMRSIGPP